MRLATANGQAVPVQTWPLAYWPDGSVKWTGHAIAATANLAGPLTLTPGASASAPAVSNAIKVAEDATVVMLQSRPETVWSRAPQAPAQAPSAGFATGMDSLVQTLMNPLAARRAADVDTDR